jgi:hypothetical protein
MSIFEAAMLICFAASWVGSLHKSITSRTSAGKSLLFLIIVETGYIAGFMHKIIYNMDIVILLYTLNALMVFTDICLYFRNLNYDRAKIT